MKMETPKMDVVRFQEADVLAASTPTPGPLPTSFALTGFNDKSAGNAKIDGADATTTEQISAKLEAFGNSYFQYQSNTPVHFGELHNSDYEGPIEDGIYYDQGFTDITSTIYGRLWKCQ